jgi:hypothetical protein
MPRDVTAPSMDAHEVDEDEELSHEEIAELLRMKPSQLRKEKREAKRKEEFWSDSCWTEPL